MNSYIRRAGIFLLYLGFDPRRLFSSLRFFPMYLVAYFKLRRSIKKTSANTFALKFLPILSDRYMTSGIASGHYFHQDLWAARRIYSSNPLRHVDVGSRIDGFVAHLLVFREVEVLDVRDLKSKIPELRFTRTDLMQSSQDNSPSIDSLSCLHALEHFGLGRYGDPINANGWFNGLQNLAMMLRCGGRLYLSVPIGQQVIEYNAQRIFNPRTIVEAASTVGLTLIEFSYVDDDGDFHEDSHIDEAVSCMYGCGCYLFERARQIEHIT